MNTFLMAELELAFGLRVKVIGYELGLGLALMYRISVRVIWLGI